MTQEEAIVIQTDKAKENKESIIIAKFNVAANYLTLAKLLKENRDNSYWKLSDSCDSFDEFLGMPEIGFSRSKAYSLIQIWELYKDKMGIDDHTLLDVGNSKLLMIAPLVEKDKEWLHKARLLSKSDLRLEINGVSGRESISPPSKSPAPPSSCVNGCQGDVDRHHFPVGRVSSMDEKGDWTIPLCRKCHTEYHQEPKEWTWTYRKNWMRYLVNRGE